ncbi:hypothetical protein DFH29DRAFT_880990 [Suillus ampliporus]|nr:hypothetical protein DFH29DRAFT_880990 [Suillus ampliporus]
MATVKGNTNIQIPSPHHNEMLKWIEIICKQFFGLTPFMEHSLLVKLYKHKTENLNLITKDLLEAGGLEQQMFLYPSYNSRYLWTNPFGVNECYMQCWPDRPTFALYQYINHYNTQNVFLNNISFSKAVILDAFIGATPSMYALFKDSQQVKNISELFKTNEVPFKKAKTKILKGSSSNKKLEKDLDKAVNKPSEKSDDEHSEDKVPSKNIMTKAPFLNKKGFKAQDKEAVNKPSAKLSEKSTVSCTSVTKALEKPLGKVVISREKSPISPTGSITVDAESRNMQLGTQLVDLEVDFFKKSGKSRVILWSSQVNASMTVVGILASNQSIVIVFEVQEDVTCFSWEELCGKVLVFETGNFPNIIAFDNEKSNQYLETWYSHIRDDGTQNGIGILD